MTDCGKTILFENGFLRLLDIRIEKFDHLAAADTMQVIMMRMQIGVLIFPWSIVLAGVSGEAGFSDQLHGSEHGSLADGSVNHP